MRALTGQGAFAVPPVGMVVVVCAGQARPGRIPGISRRHRVDPRTCTASRHGRATPGRRGRPGSTAACGQDGIEVAITAFSRQVLLPAVLRYGRGRRPRNRRHRRNYRQPVRPQQLRHLRLARWASVDPGSSTPSSRSALAGSTCKRPGGGSPAGPPSPGSASSILTTSTTPPGSPLTSPTPRPSPGCGGHPPPLRRYRRRFDYTL